MVKNKIEKLIKELGISAYRFAQETGIGRNTVYSLKNNPTIYPKKEIVERIISRYKVAIADIVEWVD